MLKSGWQQTAYNGQTIYVYVQGSKQKVRMHSAGNKPTSLATIDKIGQGAQIACKVNASYFQMLQNQSDPYGTVYGVVESEEYSQEPKQGAMWVYALMNNGSVKACMDTEWIWRKADCQFAVSPAAIMLLNGREVQMKSPVIPAGKLTNQNTQTLILRLKDGQFALAAVIGKLTLYECREWAETVGALDMVALDSGGSTQMQWKSGLYSTGRAIANVVSIEGEEDPDSEEIIDVKPVQPVKNQLRGIDISNWQAGLDLSKIDCDFVIVKATEGTHFVDKQCDRFFQQAKKLGKKLGFYHFARPSNDPIQEARYFYENTKNYFGLAIPVLDWEATGYNHLTGWAKSWLDEVYRLSGVKPMIYMSESVVLAYDWSAVAEGDYGLWVAKYRDNIPDYNYDMSNAGTKPRIKYWSFYAMWQWTSSGKLDGYEGNLDCDVFYGSEEVWDKYAGVNNGVGNTVPEQPVVIDPDYKKQAEELQKKIDWYLWVIGQADDLLAQARKVLAGK